MDRAGLIAFDLVDLARTDLAAVFTAFASLLVDHRVHINSD
jgi:hypothetical protein